MRTFKSGDRVKFNQAFLSDFEEQLQGTTQEELQGTVQGYSEDEKLIVVFDWEGATEAIEAYYFEPLDQ